MLHSCSPCLNWTETAALFALSFATMISKPQWQFAQAKQTYLKMSRLNLFATAGEETKMSVLPNFLAT